MKVVITHTDLRIYWPSRIAALQEALEQRGDELITVEIAGAGSPYAFSDPGGSRYGKVRNWICLFPAERMEAISPARACRMLLAKLDELNPDVILSGGIAFPSGATAVYWAKTHHKSVVIFDDVRPEDVPRNLLVNFIKKLIYDQVDAILCPASPWKKGFLRWNFRPEQLFFGVDVVDNAFWGGPAEGGTGLAGDGSAEGGNSPAGASEPASFFLAVGRQIPAKNFFFLLQVYEQYLKARGDRGVLPLVLVGDGPERSRMESYIRARGLQQVLLLPFLDPLKLRALYHHAAALVLPSLSETWGLVVNEAMAAGLPVLVSDACGCASVLVEEGVNGYTFSPERPESLLAALLSFTEKDPAARAVMGSASRRIIRPWGLDQFVKGCLLAINYAMANRKPCRSMPARWVLQHWKGRYRPV